jgi:hypothetical protein
VRGSWLGAKCGNAHDIADADCSENEQYWDCAEDHEGGAIGPGTASAKKSTT